MADQTFAVNCGFFDAINSDRTYSADEMNRPYRRIISNGVFATPQGNPSTDLQVVESTGMNIICKKGEGLFADKWFENPSSIVITVPDNTGTVPRIDSVLVQVDTRTSGRVGNIVHRTGTPASSPVPPAINQTEGVKEYRLANIRVNAGVTSIQGRYITDRRGSSDCPWVTSLIYQVDTSTLYDQWQAAYAEYFEQEKAIWDAWYAQLTEDLDVSMTLDRHVNTVTTNAQTTGTIPIGLAYNHNTDILEVYINGLRAIEGTHYVVVNDDTAIMVENQLDIGQTVTFVVMRSVISGSATNITVLLQELESQIAGIAGGTPTVVDSTSDMTEHDKIYVLSSDSKWYYYSATAEDWVIGGTYGGVPTDTTLTQAGRAADSKAVGDALDALDTRVTDVEDDLNVNLDMFNCRDLLREFGTYSSAEKDGVTFTWNNDHTECNANGTASSGLCFNVLYASSNALPTQLEAGETYIFRVHTTANTKLRLYMYQFHSDSTLDGYSYITTDTVVTLPSTLIGITLRIQVKSSESVSNDKISVFITKTKTNAELASDLNVLPQPKGVLPSDIALNGITDAGVWLLTSSFDYTDSPLPHGKSGVLEVVKTGTGVTVQRITRYDGTCVYYRTSDTQGSFADRTWTELIDGDTYNNTYTTEVYNNSYTVTCSPTITTDTNNFLASTGDTTDRTSAIQAMLNSTGICRLGAGDFYVTGISIPDFGSLVGSGNATRLILDSSVTNGCAINLGNNCVVRDLGIYGQATGTYTGQATVGTRHGILWTATADAESPTRKRRCIIENCQFWYFAGGAITCSNVGGNIDSNLLVSNCFIYGCDAGINIAYYSEFHRITNVSVTHCYYGCICNGGNCNFVNCSFSYNMVGVLMDNSTGQSPNNSHGVFSACTICHSGSDNDGIAIKVLGCGNGEIFTGLQVHFGSIVIDDSKAIRFVACQFGRSVPMTLTDNTLITFSDCSVSDTSIPTVTQSGNTTIAFDRCYKYDGTVFNPTA